MKARCALIQMGFATEREVNLEKATGYVHQAAREGAQIICLPELAVNVAITICYDRHFPEGPRALALAGADVLFVPTATANGAEIWDLELRAHAVANLMWVGGVNRVGVDSGGGPGRFYGRSLF